MKIVSRPALALALAMAVPLAGPAAIGAVHAQAMSPAVGKPLQQAQTAAKAGNVAAAEGFIKQAQAAAKTAEDRAKVGQMAAFVYTRGGKFAQAAAELERIGAPASQLAPLYYQARQYDKAVAAAQKSGQTTIVAQSYLQQGKAADAARIYQQIVSKNPNNPTALQNLAGAQYKMGDKKAYLATTQKLIRLDPTPTRWRALLVDMKSSPMSREGQLALYQLMRETGNLTSAADVNEFAKLAIVGGQGGSALDAIKAATAAGVVKAGDPAIARLVDAASKRQAAALKTAAADAKDPAKALMAGNAYFGAGQYPQAIAAFTTAAKGPQANEAALMKGIAQVRAGQAPAARTTFAAAGGKVQEIAGLWNLYASTKR